MDPSERYMDQVIRGTDTLGESNRVESSFGRQPEFGTLSSAYEYSPLSSEGNAVRLLRIKPGAVGDPIHCNVEEISLDRPIEYFALSYAWGHSPRSHIIWLDGKLFTVGDNLFSALHHLRDESEELTLWIDAICINQNDRTERSTQIMIMSSIYGKASSVIVWLGPGDHHSRLAFEWLGKTATELRDLLSDLPEDEMKSDNQSDNRVLEYDFNLSRAETAALINTFGMRGDGHMNSIFGESTMEGRCWWHRKWVIQEVYHAKTVRLRCGYLECDWEFLPGFSQVIAEWADKLLDSIHTKQRRDIVWAKYAFGAVGPLSSLTRKSSSAIPTLSLEDAILESRYFESTEPRDHVYALLNICCFPIRTITPDYTKPVQTVFADATKVIISESLNLDILCRAQGKRSYSRSQIEFDEEIRPSWSPNFARMVDNTFGLRVVRPRLYCASGKKSLMHDWADLGEDILRLRGILCDVVTTVTTQIPMAPRESFMDEFLSWEESHLKPNIFPGCHSQNDATEEAYLRILLWDSIPISEITRRRGDRRRIITEELAKYKYAWAQRWKTRDTIVREKLPPLADHSGMMPESRMRLQIMFEDLRAFSRGYWSFCLTRKGYMGWVPYDTKVGDLVSVLYGSSVPLVLRPYLPPALANSNTPPENLKPRCFTLIGTSYLQGMMDGELVEAVQRKESFEETIHIY